MMITNHHKVLQSGASVENADQWRIVLNEYAANASMHSSIVVTHNKLHNECHCLLLSAFLSYSDTMSAKLTRNMQYCL